MKILLLYDCVYPESLGGVEHRNHELAAALGGLGHEVTIAGFAVSSRDVAKNARVLSLGPPGKLYDAHGKRRASEALRFAHFLSPEGVALINTRPVLPVTVTCGKADYPPLPEIIDPIKARCSNVIATDATALAEKAGTAQAMNVVMLGARAGYIPLSEELILQALSLVVPQRFLEANKKAFALGKAEVE